MLMPFALEFTKVFCIYRSRRRKLCLDCDCDFKINDGNKCHHEQQSSLFEKIESACSIIYRSFIVVKINSKQFWFWYAV